MSIAEKWNEYWREQEIKFADGGPIERIFLEALQRAFYAGAEATLQREFCAIHRSYPCSCFQAEIDQFRRKA